MKVDINNRKFVILLIGAGGIGGNLAIYLSQLVRSFNNRLEISFIIMDGDDFEASNQNRQPCSSKDISKNKAHIIAKKCNNRFNLSIRAIQSYLRDSQQLHDIFSKYASCVPILIGGVDNNKARIIMHEYFNQAKDLIYIDGGNEDWNGEVVTGCKLDNEILAYPKLHFYPSILEGINVEETTTSMGCEVISHTEPQYLCANLKVMTEILSIISKMFIDRYLDAEFIKFDIKENYAMLMESACIPKEW